MESLSHMRPPRGHRLMIVSNGAAPAALALDELYARNGKLAVLSDETVQQLNAVLPEGVGHGNPLDLKDDATPTRYLDCISVLLDSHDLDALMLIHAPSAVAPATETAEKIIQLVQQHPRGKQLTLLTNWCGEYSSQAARRAFTQAGIPTGARRKVPLPPLCTRWNTGVIRSYCGKPPRYRPV